MPRPSSIDRLPSKVREMIGQLREQGHTIDEILSHLADMQTQISRSALGRHIRGLDELGEKMRRSRAVAESLVRQLGDAPESRTARLNIELLHSALLDLFMNAEGGDESGKAALQGNPEGFMFLAKALDHLGRAQKSNVDAIAAVEKRAEERARAAAAEAVDSVAKAAGGVSAETVSLIKAKIFGVDPKEEAKGRG